MKREPKKNKKLLLTTEKVRDMTKLSEAQLNEVAGGIYRETCSCDGSHSTGP